jgi:hypothetical protein
MIKHAPDVVHTAALVEPPLPLEMADFPEFTSVVGRALNVHPSGGKRGAMDVLAGAIVGSDVPAEVENGFREKYSMHGCEMPIRRAKASRLLCQNGTSRQLMLALSNSQCSMSRGAHTTHTFGKSIRGFRHGCRRRRTSLCPA